VGVDRVVLHDFVSREGGPLESVRARWNIDYLLVQQRSMDGRLTETLIDPPDWVAFALLSIGAVIVLYSISLPGRDRAEK